MFLNHFHWSRKAVVFLLAMAVAGIPACYVGALTAQDTEEEEKELPEVEDITLQTKDEVLLRCSWYPGQNEKKSVPVILLHGWDGQRQEFKALAEILQKENGCAVLVPDLRGHGESMKTRTGTELDREKFGRREVASIFEDLEQCRRFLQDKNNKAELNLEMLTIVACQESAIFAVDWAIRDWSYPDFNGQKQGKFVKALILLSPEKSFMGMSMTVLSRAPLISGRGAIPLTMMIAVGADDARKMREFTSIHNLIEKTRPEYKVEGNTDEERAADEFKKKSLFYLQYPAEDQGTKLLASPKVGPILATYISSFIKLKIADRELDFPWHELPR